MQRVWSTYLDPRVHYRTSSTSFLRNSASDEHNKHSYLNLPTAPNSPSLQMESSSFSRRSSAAYSNHSQVPLTQLMHQEGSSGSLDPPNIPFASSMSRSGSSSPIRPASLATKDASETSGVSLTVNYLPTKFSSTLLQPGARKRKGKSAAPAIPKLGGGLDAFKSGEMRMGGEDDDEYNNNNGVMFGQTPRRGKLRWNKFKWTLFVANTLLTIYTVTGLILCLVTWFDIWKNADVVRTGNRIELVISTLAASFGIITSLVGWLGLLLNNRAFLAVYTFLLWIDFIFLLVPGYLTYKRRAFNLEGKINAQWSRDLGTVGRLRIQNQLQCCGYFSPFVEATVSQTCYARSVLPGCKQLYMDNQRVVLERWYTIVFSLVPLHLFVIISGLLCSNHVTYRFGKGMMPKAYRLSMNSMAIIMDNYANQLAEQYGTDVASEILARSKSNLQLDAMPTMPYSSQQQSINYNRYDSIGSRAPEAL